jgi:16S rRNA (cytosine1402-N4)-methyltransferase
MQNPCVCPPQAPICTCGKKPVAKVMGGGAIRPGKEELAFNPRSHSATLRVAQKL